MKKRILAAILCLVMVISNVPAMPLFAADNGNSHQFVWDRDGIDAGAEYLIVSASSGTANALRINPSSVNKAYSQNVTINNGVISEFADDDMCTFKFTSASTGAVMNGNYYLHVRSGPYFSTTTPGSNGRLSFAHFNNGSYGIYTGGGFLSTLYYLKYENGGWETISNWNAYGTNASSYGSFVYLFKKVETHSVTYSGNGHTTGTVPEGQFNMNSGDRHIVTAPEGLEKVVDQNNSYLFHCWNTSADGTGTDYLPGDEVIMGDSDIILYAKWYLQTRYVVSVITNYNGVPTDFDDIIGEDKEIYVLQDNDATKYKYLKLTKESVGVYSTTVPNNGTYHVYFKNADGTYENAHGHQIVIYNQNGSTTLQNYSVTYKVDTVAANDGENTQTWTEVFHGNTMALVTETIPVRKGYVFKGWKTSDEEILQAGALLSNAITEPITLEAVWEEANNITVNITVKHDAKSSGYDNSDTKSEVEIQLLQEQENSANQPMGDPVVLNVGSNGFVYDETNHITRYTYNFNNLPQGTYNVSTSKKGYDIKIEKSADGKTINVTYEYMPTNRDLYFDVVIAAGSEVPKDLYPKAVNVKVSYWGKNSAGNLGWHIITQQEGNKAPTTVNIDPNTRKGSGFYSVWENWSGSQEPYYYRVEVTSYIMPDGTVVRAETQDSIIYTPSGSGLYKGTLTVTGGENPTFPENAALSGAFFENGVQKGQLVVTVDITPFQVVFDAGEEGKINGERTYSLENQYAYPNLNEYVPVPENEDTIFLGWYLQGVDQPATNQYDQYLEDDVRYVAKWKNPRKLEGTITVQAHYPQGNDTVEVHPADRAQEVVIVLQKKTGESYNDIAVKTLPLTYEFVDDNGNGKEDEGEECKDATTTYSFIVPNDGAEYRIHVLELNYLSKYNNDNNQNFTEDECVIPIQDSPRIDVELTFAPQNYAQDILIDTSRINVGYRPTKVLAQVAYRNLGSQDAYNVISQHTEGAKGVPITLAYDGMGSGKENVWNWHTDGALYEYQVKIAKLYGNDNVFASEGTEYDPTQDLPYEVHYGPTSWWDNLLNSELGVLKATFVPKRYNVIFDMNCNDDETIWGMEEFATEDNGGNQFYSYEHVWSYRDEIVAHPFRLGYVFKGWEEVTNTGVTVNQQIGEITIGADCAGEVRLEAQWEKLEGTYYVVRHLELNTDKVLQGAQVFKDNVTSGTVVKVVERCAEIQGYKYAGYKFGTGPIVETGKEQDFNVGQYAQYPLITIYYLPDGSDGYTEQVESNLHINKDAHLENDGTYTITMDMYTTDNPITTYVQQNTPLDIVLVLDQSGSIVNSGYLDDLQASVKNFINLIAEHGRTNEVDHRIAMVGYAGNETDDPTGTDTNKYPIAGGDLNSWINTGVFDSNGDFHPYPVTGFNYTAYNDKPEADGIYYVYSKGEYLLLMHHDEYHHLLTEAEARTEMLEGNDIYGYVGTSFVKLSRNLSGLWLYGNNQLYSSTEFFTYHKDVWTHRQGIDKRQIHAYGTGDNYRCTDGHEGLYTRTETKQSGAQLNVYKDALIPVSIGANGAGGINPGLLESASSLGANGGTYVQYGIEMANKVFAANPLEENSDRLRIMVMFTDGLPGRGTFDENVANQAISHAYETKNTHNAFCYTIGLYQSSGVSATSDIGIYMNAVSSNCPTAKKMDDVYQEGEYVEAQNGDNLNDGRKYYVYKNTGNSWWPNWQMLELKYGTYRQSYTSYTGWYYTQSSSNKLLTEEQNAVVTNGVIGGETIYVYTKGYIPGQYSNAGYYSTTESVNDLIEYFANVMKEITTKITTEIVLHSDTIMRDIMGQGFRLTENTIITVKKRPGIYNTDTHSINWSETCDENATVVFSMATALQDKNRTQGEPLKSTETANISYGEGENVVTKAVPYVQVYNWDATNTTNPDGENYHPHTIDITGYDFTEGYISESKTTGYKMEVTVTKVEAQDDVEWSRSTHTNNETSGIWLPADANGNRQLLLPFDQPTTLFTERTYVLDYAKPFTLSGWYYNHQDIEGKGSLGTPKHIDMDISNGMNGFDVSAPTVSSKNSLLYGNVSITDEKVSFEPTTMQWKEPSQFYVFGETTNQIVRSQDANVKGENGEKANLWTKVNVIPANNVYYEDTFVTTESEDVTEDATGMSGFVYTGDWKEEFTGEHGVNTETPEHMEDKDYGDVHGWIDSMQDDKKYSDGSAHATKQRGANVSFTFVGTGVDIYTRTNDKTGMVVAQITDSNGKIAKPTIVMDNLAKSGDYYNVPTVSFQNLAYGTYTVRLVATSTSAAETGAARYEYYLDGIRVYNPLGGDRTVQNQHNEKIKDAYAKEQNAVFTTVRDILLEYEDFNKDMADGSDGKKGAVFIDAMPSENGDTLGTPTYDVGEYKNYGPKNETYLSPGQAIVLKVDPKNIYYVGLKSISGEPVNANVSGITQADPITIPIEHSVDMYYQITPIDGYIVIGNDMVQDDSTEMASETEEPRKILSVTKLCTTNLYAPVTGVVAKVIEEEEAVEMVSTFALMMRRPAPAPEPLPEPLPEPDIPNIDVPDEEKPSVDVPVVNKPSTDVPKTETSKVEIPKADMQSADAQSSNKTQNNTATQDETTDLKEIQKDQSVEQEDETTKKKQGFWDKIVQFFKKVWTSIVDWIRKLTGGAQE